MNVFLDEPRPVRSGEELNIAQLETYLKDTLPGLDGTIDVRQFPSGYSNLTYLVSVGDTEMVLRRPPVGSKVKAAHDMRREYRVLSALHPVYPKAPRPLVYCENNEVLGAPFYVMERIKGVILRGKKPDGFACPPELARQICNAFVENLAELHHVDYKAVGLADLKKEGSFTHRQVNGWLDRYRGSQTDEIADIEQIADYLQKNCPEDTGEVFIHNDYKFDNLVLDPNDLSRIVGVLDWEMSTIGDPLMELGVVLSYWHEQKDLSLGVVPCFLTLEPGSMTRREVAEAYAAKTGADIQDILFYYVFGLLKLAVIAQQIYYRYKQGLTKDERFEPLIFAVGGLGMMGTAALESGRL